MGTNMKIYFIRHGRTLGNLEKRYVGRTDESLCEEENVRLAKICFPKVEKVYTSSMKRCIETAQILYPDQDPMVVDHLQECDFGAFEYKNYEELKDEKAYQTFLETMGESGFPEGEKLEDFKERCRNAFRAVLKESNQEKAVAFVVHGGTIMAILDAFSSPHKDYYDWQVGNGEGFAADFYGEENGKFLLRHIKHL